MDDISETGAGDSGVESIVSNDVIMIAIRISIPELNLQKSLQFNQEETVCRAKQHVLSSFDKELKNGFNYGFYCPPMNGKAGKFLDEERPLKEYLYSGFTWNLEFKMKRRVYKNMNVTAKRAKQLHSKGSLKQFMDHIRKMEAEKIIKLLNKGMDPNFIETDCGETPLTMACLTSEPSKVIMALVGGGAHLDFRNKKGMTPLHAAAQKGNEEAIKILLDLGSSTNYKDSRGLTPLYLGVCSDVSARCIEMLLYDHSVVDTTDEQGWTELHQSCKEGRVQHAELLIYYGADLNKQNCSGNTPLHVSVISNREECARMLMFRGANKSILNHANKDAYHCAVVAGYHELAETIRKFSSLEAVPYLDAPKYNSKRRALHQFPKGALKRCRSNPLMNFSPNRQTINPELPQGGCSLWDHQQPIGGQTFERVNRKSMAPQDLSVFEGSLPPRTLCSLNSSIQSFSISSGESSQEGEAILDQKKFEELRSRSSITRKVVLSTDSSDFGFVLRGTKADRIFSSRVNLLLTPTQPALQYFDQVKRNGLADKAGIKPGDFLLEVNGVDVTSASHEYTVSLIRNSVHMLQMLITTPTQTSIPIPNYIIDSISREAKNILSPKTFPVPNEAMDQNIASIRPVHGKRLAHDLPGDDPDSVRVVSVPAYNCNSLSRKFLWKAKSIHNISRSDDICYMFGDDNSSSNTISDNKWSGDDVKCTNDVKQSEGEVLCPNHAEGSNGYNQSTFRKSDQRLISSGTSGKDKYESHQDANSIMSFQSKCVEVPKVLASTSPSVPLAPSPPSLLSHEKPVIIKKQETFDFLTLAESARQVFLKHQKTSPPIVNDEAMKFNEVISMKNRYSVEPYRIYNTTKEISKLALVSNRRQIFEHKLLRNGNLNSSDEVGSLNEDKLTNKSPFPPKPLQKPLKITNTNLDTRQQMFKSELQLPSHPGGQMDISLTSEYSDVLSIPPPPGFEDEVKEPQQFASNDCSVSHPNSNNRLKEPMNLWSIDDVGNWLDSMGMGEHKVTFKRHNVDGLKLSTLGRNDLISLGVVQVGQRMGLERAVKKILISFSSS